MMQESDDDLVAAARSGDRKAFEALIGRHYDVLYRIAWRHCANRAEAEDIAQEACIRIARAITGFEGRSSFASWCHAITLNAVRDAMRSKARASVALAAFGALPPDAACQDDRDDLEGDALWEAVRKLPERQREVVQLVYVEALSHREAAKLIGCAEATVSWHLFAARRTLKSALART